MADVITRFKLDTTQYDSKLRDAAKSLVEYTRDATLAGNEFGKFTQKNVEAARALGNITPSATNAKDKVKELVGAFNDVAKAYNALTKEQQQSDFGKAMAESLGQLSQQLKEAKKDLYEMGDAAKKAGSGGLFSGLGDKMSGALQVFAGNMLTKAAGAVANLGSEMVDMVQQGVELAKQGEGIRIAFERLGRGDILDGLRQATHGTVTDLELMKAAVKFNDFKLPLDELGTMLAFAQQKAKDTGQSVDFLVESIVNGLGRKSLMILDNLGLSATEIKERMAETGDMTKAVGAIIREQMSKAGDYVETAADRAAQANVNLQNKMEELGRKFAPVEEASSQLWTSMKIGILDIIGGPLARLLNGLTEAGRLKNALNDMNGETGSGNTKVDQQVKKLNVIKKAGGSDYIFNSTLNGMLEDYNRQIIAFDNQIKDLSKKAGEDTEGNMAAVYEGRIRDIETKQNALKTMRDQLQAGAKELSKPVDVKIETKGAEQNGLNPTALSTTHKATPQETAANKVKEAERTYAETLLKNSIRLEEGMDSTLEYKKRELSAQERLFDAYNDAYATYQDPAYKKASTEAAEKIRKLAGEVKVASDAQDAAMKSARELDTAQRKLADAQQKLAETRATGSATAVYKAQQEVDKRQKVVEQVQYVADVKAGKMPTLPENMKAEMVVTANTDEAVRALQAIQGIKIDSKSFTVSTDDAEALAKVSEIDGVTIGPKTFTISTDNEEALAKVRDIQDLKIDPKTVKIVQDVSTNGEKSSFDNLVETVQAEIKFDQMKVDETALHTLLQTALQNGLDGLALSYEGIQKKIAKGIDIPDSTWIELQNEINEKLAEMGIKPIKINFETGEIAKDGKEAAKDWRDVSTAISAVGSAMSSIEDPTAKIVGTIAQAIATIALTYAKSLEGTFTIWDWIAGAASGAATMVSVISTIHSATGYANGGIVKGNSYSGDNIGAMVDGSQMVGLNAGELVLTHAQQSALANELQGGGMQNMRLQTEVRGRSLIFVIDNELKAQGKGQLASFK